MAPVMKNPTLKYLLKLEDFYHLKEAGEFINSKIRAFSEKENALFCHGCSRTFLLKVNARAKLENGKYTVTCQKCGSKTVLAA